MSKHFKVAGVSRFKGKYKVRFANDMMRVKVLAKGGHTDVDLIDLPKAMTKPAVVTFLLAQDQFKGEARIAIEAADVKYNGKKTVAVSGKKVVAKSKAAPKAAPKATPTPATAPAETA